MLQTLFIKNVVLIEEAQVHFEPGFNVLSGESGSGKTAVMCALQLALGGRSDVDLIRHGQEKASVEAQFDIQNNSVVQRFLEEKGMDLEDPSMLSLKRELNVSGKSRAFVNHRPVQISLLRELGEKLVEIVSQHANHRLFDLSYHRLLLDSFGKLDPLQKEYHLLWTQYQRLTCKIQQLKTVQPGALREIENCKREIEEIENSHLSENEDQEIFEEYTLLSSSEERLSLATNLENLLSNEKGIMDLLTRAKHQAHELSKLDNSFNEGTSLLHQAAVEIEECLRTIRTYQTQLEVNPAHLFKLDQRLKELHRLKLKYGSSIAEIYTYLLSQKEQLKKLLNLEEELNTLSEEQETIESKLLQKAEQLTHARQTSAEELQTKANNELHALNMPHAQFLIQLTKIEYNPSGQDQVEFFLSSNAGERTISIREGVSGGELARVILALHLIDAEKEKTATLIFDEIDASIGGTTASKMGQIFKKLGEKQQIFSITHFPQVAKSADHHLQISKQVQEGRTFTAIQTLSIAARELELQRMIGG